LSYFASDSPFRTQVWGRINQWNHIYMGTTYKDTHQPGFINNTRVMTFGHETWIKSKATGLWKQLGTTNSSVGEWWSPDFVQYNGPHDWTPQNYRIESSTGYPSILPVRAPHGSSRIWHTDANYWLWHGYTLFLNVDAQDVADVTSFCKVALVVNDPSRADDREFSRYIFAVGSDWYPPSGLLSTYPGVGTSRHRWLTARWPNWQYAIMHTMTEAQFTAPGGYPPALATVSEGSTNAPTDPGGGSGGSDGGGTGTGGVGGVTPPPVAPTRGAWFAKLTGGANTWTGREVANVETSKIRRRRGNKIWR
jgi:hypothetical protein